MKRKKQVKRAKVSRTSNAKSVHEFIEKLDDASKATQGSKMSFK